MVKHQRRSHQRGLHPNELLDDYSSESDSADNPSTPRPTGLSWGPLGAMPPHPMMPHGHPMQRATSFADFGHSMHHYGVQQQQQQQHQSQPQPQLHHRHSHSGGIQEYHGPPVHEQVHHAQMLQRTPSMPPQHYYVIEHHNPGIATMNPAPIRTYQIPHQQVEPRAIIEMPYQAPGITELQSSPSNFSAASGRSPSVQEAFYTHQPTHNATYALHGASQPEQQQPMVQYPEAMPQHIDHSQQPVPTVHHQPPTPEPYREPSPQREPEAWYHYQTPAVELTTIGQLPPFGLGGFDLYGGVKLEFEDPSMPLPSSRIDTM